MKKRGFTLIELLVIIAIIVILAAIIWPVINRARAAHRQGTATHQEVVRSSGDCLTCHPKGCSRSRVVR